MTGKIELMNCAIGFQAQKYLHSLKVTGQNGIDLQDHMRGDGRGISSYKGTVSIAVSLMTAY